MLCLSSLLFFGSFNMLIPELPDYLTSLGGEDYKGGIIAVFAVMAAFSRPFSGKLTDRVGRVPILMFGAFVCFLCGFVYPMVTTVAGFMMLRLVHGLSTGFKPTATSAYVADLIPENKRGEALGILGMAGSTGMAIAPFLGSEIARVWGINVLFYASSAVSILSVLILAGLKETLEDREPFRLSLLKINKDDVYEPRVKHAAVVMFLSMFSFGIVLTLIPDFSKHLGVANKGIYFTVFTLASVSCRFFAGRLSDLYGRTPVIKAATLILAVGMALTANAEDLQSLLLGAAFVGLGFGSTTPSIFAWTIDESDPYARGRAIATMYIALEVGIGLGSVLSAEVYQNRPEMFPPSFMVGAGLAVLAWFYISGYEWARKRKLQRLA